MTMEIMKWVRRCVMAVMVWGMVIGIAAGQGRAPKYDNIADWLKFGKKNLRRTYRAGATGPYAFDCSGFTMYMFKELGIDLPHNSDAQSAYGEKVSARKALPGDLVFYCGSKGRKIGHVGIVYEKKDGEKFTFIHASTSQGVVIDESEQEYYKTRFKEIRRLTSDKELYALKHGMDKAKKDEEVKERARKEEEARAKEEERAREEALRKEEKAREDAMKAEREAEAKKDENATNKEVKKKKKSRKERKAEEKAKKEKEAKKKEENGKKGVERERKTHTVAASETLYRISRAYGVSVEDLQKWNGIKGTGISVGQKVYVEE